MDCASVKTSQSMSFNFCLYSTLLNEDACFFLRSDVWKHTQETYQRAGFSRPWPTAANATGDGVSQRCHQTSGTDLCSLLGTLGVGGGGTGLVSL